MEREHNLQTFIVRNCRAVVQAVSRWFPSAGARVRVRVACGICGGQSGTGRFSQNTSVSPVNHHSTNFSIIIITSHYNS
jgi:hypothetical protein